MKIAINGLGRMGRLFLRAAVTSGLDVVAINEPKGDLASLALGIEFDSVQGRFAHPVAVDGNALVVGSARIPVSQTTDAASLPWRDLGVDLVVECSGKVKKSESLAPWLADPRLRVLVSNPVPGVPNLVYGVNDASCDFAKERVVTAASCTTNCLAPVVRVLHDGIGIERGLVTTIHDPTNTQGVVDRADDCGRRADDAGLADPFHAAGDHRRLGGHVPEAEVGYLHRAGDEEAHEVAVHGLAVLVVEQFLHERRSDPLGGAAVKLPLDDHGVQHRAAVVEHGVVDHLGQCRLGVRPGHFMTHIG